MTESYPGAQAVSRAIAVLRAFDDRHPSWGLGELSEYLGLNKTTTHRLLAALESEGLIERATPGGVYRLGPELIALGGSALRSHELRTLARPEMERLAQEVGEAVALEILHDGQTLLLDEVSNRAIAGVPADVGSRLPLHATSTGKLLLAHQPPERLAAHLDQALPQLTAQTITDPLELSAALAQIRQQGYAQSKEEFEVGFVAVAAPIYNHTGAVVAALGIGGPALRMTEEQLPKLIAALQVAARQLSRTLGYRPG